MPRSDSRGLRGHRLALALATAAAVPVAAQDTPAPLPTTNPAAVVRERLVVTDIEVRYHRPSRRGRAIFGALVPWNEVWRTGADNATTITFSTPISLNGAAVKAGTYELFTIPGEREWTVMLQEHRGQWGAYKYDASQDAVRLKAVPASAATPVETFTISVDSIGRGTAVLAISWDRVRVPVTMAVDVRATAVPVVEAALAAQGRKPYFLAAMFYHEYELDPERAATLIAEAVAAAPTHIGILHRQALILERKGDRAGAIAAAERSLAGAADSPEPLRDEYTRLNTAVLERLRSK